MNRAAFMLGGIASTLISLNNAYLARIVSR